MSQGGGNKAWRIILWVDRHSNYEQSRSGGLWIACPTSFDSLGLKRLLRGRNGLTHFGAYVLLAELAAKGPVPGVLANKEGPLSLDDIADVTNAPARVLGAALERLSAKDIAWIDEVQWPVPSGHRHDPADPLCTDAVRTPSGQPPDNGRASRAPARPHGGSSSILKPASEELSEAAAAACAMLQRAGAMPDKAQAAAATIGGNLSGLVALWHLASKDPTARSVGGVVCAKIKAGQQPPRLTIDAVFAAVKAGIVHEIDGRDVTSGEVTRNNQGVYIDHDVVVRTADLQKARYA